MKRLNNKGFTLVELVIASAILSVVAITVAALMTSGTNMYSGIQRKASMLYKSQVACAQLQQAISESTDSIAVYDSSLYIASKDNQTVTVYYVDPDTNCLMVRIDTVNVTDSGTRKIAAISQTGSESEGTLAPFSSNVTASNFIPITTKNDSGEDETNAVNFNLTFIKNGVTYNKNEVVSTRNKPIYVSGADETETVANLLNSIWR